MRNLPIEFELITPEALYPERGTPGSAGWDLFSNGYIESAGGNQPTLVPTGVRVDIPPGWVGLIWPRSSWAVKQGITTDAGVVDSDYRGEIMVALKSPLPFHVEHGDKIAQMVVVPFHGVAVPGKYLDETERGDGGFGSTG
jgi:dUTP pyrophosphatase